MDWRLPGSSAHGILQARIVDWVAMPSCRGPRARKQDAKVRPTVKAVWKEVRALDNPLTDRIQDALSPLSLQEELKKAKWLSEEALQIAKKRKEVKGKGEKERYTHLNAGFQRTAQRDKKAFLSDQCKEIEENNRMRKTRDLFKKIRDTKGTVHAKMGTTKDRNDMDLTEAEDIKKRWQEYTEELYKKYLHDPDNQMVWSLTWSQTSWNAKPNGP